MSHYNCSICGEYGCFSNECNIQSEHDLMLAESILTKQLEEYELVLEANNSLNLYDLRD